MVIKFEWQDKCTGEYGRCEGKSYTNDEYVYYPGCWMCSGKGKRWYSKKYSTGFFFHNVGTISYAWRSFQEGYSAGVTDCRA
jgi:hypothetical protein